MKTFKLSIFIVLLLIPPCVSAAAAAEDIDQGYAALNEAYQARRAGNQELAQEKLAVALDIFRGNASESGP